MRLAEYTPEGAVSLLTLVPTAILKTVIKHARIEAATALYQRYGK